MRETCWKLKSCRWVLPLLLCAASGIAAPLHAQTDTPQSTPDPGAAQDGGPRRGGPESHAEMMTRQLDLTPEQTARVKALFESERGKMEELHSNTNLSQEEMHSRMHALHAATQSQIRAVLTPDQATKYDAMLARMREHMRDGEGAGQEPPPPPPGAPQF